MVNATPRRLGIHCIGGWVDPRASLDGGEKFRSPAPHRCMCVCTLRPHGHRDRLGFDPRTFQPAAFRYTDSAIPGGGGERGGKKKKGKIHSVQGVCLGKVVRGVMFSSAHAYMLGASVLCRQTYVIASNLCL